MRVTVLYFLIGLVLGEQLSVTLPFTNVIICAPFNVLIRPSTNPDQPFLTYINAAQQVIDVIDLAYVEDTLTISTRASFESPESIQIILYLPPDKLQSVVVQIKVDVVVDGIFNVPSLQLVNTDDGSLYVSKSIVTGTLTISSAKNGFVVFTGETNNANLDVSRNGRIILTDVIGNVEYQGSGRTKVYINPTVDKVKITGNAASLAQVNVAGQFCKSSCLVQGRSRFRSPCVCIDAVQVPEEVFDLQFTCGLTVLGVSQCSDSRVTGQVSSTTVSATTVGFASARASSGSAVTKIVNVYTDCMTSKDSLKMVQ